MKLRESLNLISFVLNEKYRYGASGDECVACDYGVGVGVGVGVVDVGCVFDGDGGA